MSERAERERMAAAAYDASRPMGGAFWRELTTELRLLLVAVTDYHLRERQSAMDAMARTHEAEVTAAYQAGSTDMRREMMRAVDRFSVEVEQMNVRAPWHEATHTDTLDISGSFGQRPCRDRSCPHDSHRTPVSAKEQ